MPHLLVEKLTAVETWAFGQSFYFSSCWSSVIQVLSYFIIFHTQITWWIISQRELLLTMGTQILNVISNMYIFAVSSFFQHLRNDGFKGHLATRPQESAKLQNATFCLSLLQNNLQANSFENLDAVLYIEIFSLVDSHHNTDAWIPKIPIKHFPIISRRQFTLSLLFLFS